MNPGGGRPVRIAHAYGNRRDKIEAAADADIDYLEADVWRRAGGFWVRHERRFAFIPLLFDRKPEGVDSFGPWALTIFPGHYARLDLHPISLRELLETTRGKRRLLLDIKDERPREGDLAYAEALAALLAEAKREESVIVCGQTDVLDSVREVAPYLDVRHSIERQDQWDAFRRRLAADHGLRGVCMRREFLTEPVARFLEEKGVEVFCWTVDDPEEARRLLEIGVDGIISNSIPLLERLGDG